MELVLNREPALTGGAVPGEMFMGDAHVAWTLERQPVEIPNGRYQIVLYPSSHFKRLMPMLVGVPKRSNIEIHWGDFPFNSDGCILVGEERDASKLAIWHTQDEFKILFTLIEQAVKSEGCWITVNNPQ